MNGKISEIDYHDLKADEKQGGRRLKAWCRTGWMLMGLTRGCGDERDKVLSVGEDMASLLDLICFGYRAPCGNGR